MLGAGKVAPRQVANLAGRGRVIPVDMQPTLCNCDALSWSAGSAGGRRPHDPALCARQRATVDGLLANFTLVSLEAADELRAWYGPPFGKGS